MWWIDDSAIYIYITILIKQYIYTIYLYLPLGACSILNSTKQSFVT